MNPSPNPNNPSASTDLDALIFAPINANRLKLGPPTKLKDFPDEPLWRWIKQNRKPGRGMESLVRILISEILNRVLTNRQTRFLLSRTIIEELLRSRRAMRKTISGTEKERLLDQMMGMMNDREAFLKCLKAPTKFGSSANYKRKAGLFTLANQSIISLIPWWNSEDAKFETSLESFPRNLPEKASIVSVFVSGCGNGDVSGSVSGDVIGNGDDDGVNF